MHVKIKSGKSQHQLNKEGRKQQIWEEYHQEQQQKDQFLQQLHGGEGYGSQKQNVELNLVEQFNHGSCGENCTHDQNMNETSPKSETESSDYYCEFDCNFQGKF